MTARTRHPLLLAAAGSALVAWAAIFVRLADVTAATSATFRCVYALPVLVPLAVVAARRSKGHNPTASAARRRANAFAAVGGAGLAARLLFWHAAIALVGAGMATVLVNAQVALVPFAAWLVLGERITRRHAWALPIVLAGAILISGTIGTTAFGNDPARGALLGALGAVGYAVFLLGLRGGTRGGASPVIPLTIATTVSAALTTAWGVAHGSLHLPSSWTQVGWLLALAIGCQVAGWLLITISLVRLSAATVSIVVLIQPIGSMLLGILLFAEAPAPLQWVGVLLSLAGFAVALWPERGRHPEAAA